MSNLPWFRNLTGSYAILLSLQHQAFTTSDCTFRYIHNLVSFPLWPSLFIASGAILYSLLFHSSILGTFRPGGLIFSHCIILPFRTVHEILGAKILGWFAVHLSSGPCLVRTLHYDPSVLAGPAWHGLQLHWVMQATLPLWSMKGNGMVIDPKVPFKLKLYKFDYRLGSALVWPLTMNLTSLGFTFSAVKWGLWIRETFQALKL